MWFLPLCQLIFTAAQLIWTQHCIGLEKLPQFDLSYVKFPGVYLNLCQFYHHVSWFVQLHSWFELTTGFALKNFSNLTFNMWDSLVCISILPLCQLICTADQLIWHHHWIGLEKLPQFDLSYVKFPGVYLNFTFMSADLCSWSADLTSPLDLPWKTTPIWLLIC